MSTQRFTTGGGAAKAMEAILKTNSSREGQVFLRQTMQDISQPLARNMLAKIGLIGTKSATTTEGSSGLKKPTPFKLLDHGCGLGVVAPVLMESVPSNVLQESSVLCADVSEALIESVGKRSVEEGWVNVEARVLDAQNTGLPSESFTHVVSNICFHLIPDSKAALQDSIRLLVPGGTFALTTWHAASPSWIPYLRDAFATFPPSLLPANYRFHIPMTLSKWGQWDNIDWLRETLSGPAHNLDGKRDSQTKQQEGEKEEEEREAESSPPLLEDVHVEPFAHAFTVKNVDAFMKMTAGMLDMTAGMVLGEESIAQLGGMDGIRDRVRGYLEERFGTEKGWTMTGLSIVAWGRKPESKSTGQVQSQM